MRKLIILAIVLVSIQLKAQVVKITLKSGEERTVTINASSATTLFTDVGNVQIQVIKSITFTSINDASEKLQSSLKKAGVEILIDGEERAPSVPIVVQQQEQKANIDQLEDSLERFRVDRNTGKGLMLAALVGTVGLSILQSNYNKQNIENAGKPNYESKTVSPLLYGVVGGVGIIGFTIDMGAGKHLKKNR